MYKLPEWSSLTPAGHNYIITKKNVQDAEYDFSRWVKKEILAEIHIFP